MRQLTDKIALEHKIIYFYDIEVFPNFFSALFISEDLQDEYIFYKFEDRDDIPAMVQFVTQENLLLVGYNNIWFDDIVMRLIIATPGIDNQTIYNASKSLIETKNRRELPLDVREVLYEESPWLSADMLALLRMNRNAPGLKHVAIHLEHGKLQDLPKKPHELVQPDELNEILKYNRNDVIITGRLWHNQDIQEAIRLREGLSNQYLVDLISADDSRLGNVILESAYGEPEIKQTRRPFIKGIDLIPPGLEYTTPEMQLVLDTIKKLVLVEVETKKGGITHLTFPKRQAFEYIFDFNGVVYKMAKGGLHSDDPPRILRSGNGTIYRDCDVGSYYPSLRQHYELVPAHLDKRRFLKVDKELIETRLAAKKSGDKVTAEGLKICVNGIFGKYNYQHFWLYDPLCFYQTTIYGQLLLLKLIEMLYLAGVNCVSANTDGIVCEIPADKEDVYFETCIAWQKATGMTLEYTDYSIFVQLNVNSYMSVATRETVHDSGWTLVSKDIDKVKLKKDFLDNKKLTKASFIKGYNAPIIAIALQRYFKDGTPIRETIEGHENVHDFFYTQKTGGKFVLHYRTVDENIVLQKTNRYYISETGGALIKMDTTEHKFDGLIRGKSLFKRQTAIWKGQTVCVLNNITRDRPKINRTFYVNKTQEIIDKIEPPKVLDIFNFV